MSQREAGTVKAWVVDRGYGFAIPDSGGRDVFIHIRSVHGMQELVVGDRVEFETARTLTGRIACVRRTSRLSAALRRIAMSLQGLSPNRRTKAASCFAPTRRAPSTSSCEA
jgi:cold shock protein